MTIDRSDILTVDRKKARIIREKIVEIINFYENGGDSLILSENFQITPAQAERILFEKLKAILDFNNKDSKNQAYCIHCRKKIPLNTFRPICPICYHALKPHRRDPQKYCHYMGEEFQTTILNPYCPNCRDIMNLK